jgi:hypothetical protein
MCVCVCVHTYTHEFCVFKSVVHDIADLLHAYGHVFALVCAGFVRCVWRTKERKNDTICMVCVCAHMHVLMHICSCVSQTAYNVNTYSFLHSWKHICIHTRIHTNVACMHTCIHTYVACMHTCMHTNVACMHTRMHTYVACMHTRMHTNVARLHFTV